MKIGTILTKEESRNIVNKSTLQPFNDLKISGPEYDIVNDKITANGIEYPTEEEAYEAIDEMEL